MENRHMNIHCIYTFVYVYTYIRYESGTLETENETEMK